MDKTHMRLEGKTAVTTKRSTCLYLNDGYDKTTKARCLVWLAKFYLTECTPVTFLLPKVI